MNRRIASFALLVPDYDEAISYYVDCLGFHVVEDISLSPSKRWVLMSPNRDSHCNILLAKADSKEQKKAIGNQAGGRVFLFLHTEDFDRDFDLFTNKGVTFLEEPRDEVYGKVVVFEDKFGNKWDLMQPKN